MSKKKHLDILNEAFDYVNTDYMYDSNEKSSPKYNTEITKPSFSQAEIQKYNPFPSNSSETKDDDNSWFGDTLESMTFSKRKRNASLDDFFDFSSDKKKKKKKKKDGEDKKIDYDKHFEPEMMLYDNILRDQSQYTASLQKQYDFWNSSKSQSRGLSKATTDLMENLTSARNLTLQIVDKKVNLKKTIADLTMKQEKNETGLDGENLADYGSQLLKAMNDNRAAIINGNYCGEIAEYSNDEELDNVLTDELLSVEPEKRREEESNARLRYETMNVRIYAIIDKSDRSNFQFVAFDEDTNTPIKDYPCPLAETLSINDSTGTATDNLGRKYPIIWN